MQSNSLKASVPLQEHLFRVVVLEEVTVYTIDDALNKRCDEGGGTIKDVGVGRGEADEVAHESDPNLERGLQEGAVVRLHSWLWMGG